VIFQSPSIALANSRHVRENSLKGDHAGFERLHALYSFIDVHPLAAASAYGVVSLNALRSDRFLMRNSLCYRIYLKALHRAVERLTCPVLDLSSCARSK
jgi:hypothetical protein